MKEKRQEEKDKGIEPHMARIFKIRSYQNKVLSNSQIPIVNQQKKIKVAVLFVSRLAKEEKKGRSRTQAELYRL